MQCDMYITCILTIERLLGGSLLVPPSILDTGGLSGERGGLLLHDRYVAHSQLIEH